MDSVYTECRGVCGTFWWRQPRGRWIFRPITPSLIWREKYRSHQNVQGHWQWNHYQFSGSVDLSEDEFSWQFYSSRGDGSCKIKTTTVYCILLFRRSLVTMEERILVAEWEWKPDCSGLQNEWEVRKRRQKMWTPLGRSLDERRKQELHPPQSHLPSPGGTWQRGLGESGGWVRCSVDPRTHQGGKLGVAKGLGNLKLASLKTKPAAPTFIYLFQI